MVLSLGPKPQATGDTQLMTWLVCIAPSVFQVLRKYVCVCIYIYAYMCVYITKMGIKQNQVWAGDNDLHYGICNLIGGIELVHILAEFCVHRVYHTDSYGDETNCLWKLVILQLGNKTSFASSLVMILWTGWPAPNSFITVQVIWIGRSINVACRVDLYTGCARYKNSMQWV